MQVTVRSGVPEFLRRGQTYLPDMFVRNLSWRQRGWLFVVNGRSRGAGVAEFPRPVGAKKCNCAQRVNIAGP